MNREGLEHCSPWGHGVGHDLATQHTNMKMWNMIPKITFKFALYLIAILKTCIWVYFIYLEWNGPEVKWCEIVQSCLTLCHPMDSSLHQAPPSMGFSRQEYRSGLPFSSPVMVLETNINKPWSWLWSTSAWYIRMARGSGATTVGFQSYCHWLVNWLREISLTT